MSEHNMPRGAALEPWESEEPLSVRIITQWGQNLAKKCQIFERSKTLQQQCQISLSRKKIGIVQFLFCFDTPFPNVGSFFITITNFDLFLTPPAPPLVNLLWTARYCAFKESPLPVFYMWKKETVKVLNDTIGARLVTSLII